MDPHVHFACFISFDHPFRQFVLFPSSFDFFPLAHLVFIMASFFRSLSNCDPFVWKMAPHKKRFTNSSLFKFVSAIPMNNYWELELIREITLIVTTTILFLTLIIIVNLHNPKSIVFIHSNLIGFCIVWECLVLH